MGLKERLGSHNDVAWHWTDGPEARIKAAHAQVYISSVNGLAETGELINIDGAGNRVAATLYGHQRIYFVVGRNKLAPTYEEALWRARTSPHRRMPSGWQQDALRCEGGPLL